MYARIMPNHIHFIIETSETHNKNGSSRTPTPTNMKIPFLISTLKRYTNKKFSKQIWQRNYYEHVIRNEKEYYKIKQYIEYNPLNWKMDKYYEE